MNPNDPKSGSGKPLPRPVPKPAAPPRAAGAAGLNSSDLTPSSTPSAIAAQRTQHGTGPLSGALAPSPKGAPGHPAPSPMASTGPSSGFLHSSPVSADDAPPLPEPSLPSNTKSVPPPTPRAD